MAGKRFHRRGWAWSLLALVPWLNASAEELRVAAGKANGTPFAVHDEAGRLRGGLVRDIIDALGARLEMPIRYINLPRARVETWLQEGQVDAACFLAPGWVSEPQRLHWSPPLFEVQQVLVQPANAAAATGPDDLLGKRVGTLLNFVYPDFEAHFNDRRISRQDAASLDANLVKLAQGRIDALIDVDIAVFYREHSTQLPVAIRVDALNTPADAVYCAFNPQFAERYPQLQPELQAMREDGRIARWITSYTGGRSSTESLKPNATPLDSASLQGIGSATP